MGFLTDLWHACMTLKKAGYSEDTLKAKGHRLRYLAERVTVNDREVCIGLDVCEPLPV